MSRKVIVRAKLAVKGLTYVTGITILHPARVILLETR